MLPSKLIVLSSKAKLQAALFNKQASKLVDPNKEWVRWSDLDRVSSASHRHDVNMQIRLGSTVFGSYCTTCFKMILYYFYVPVSKDRGILFYPCLSVRLSVCTNLT